MLRTDLTNLVKSAVADLIASGKLPAALSEVAVEISDTKSPEHGDYACNFALTASKKAGMQPRAIGELLKTELESSPLFTGIEIAGPGFLNLRLKPNSINAYLSKILDAGPDLPKSEIGNGEKVNVEFVSVNPNGPITIGSGRGAAFGDTICRVLDATGFKPYREYYINDGVNSQQMKLFAESVKHHYLTHRGIASEFPEGGYKGEYVEDVAKGIEDGHENDPTVWFQAEAQAKMIDRQRTDLAKFRVSFDRWFSEQSLHDEGKVAVALEKLKAAGNAYYSVKSQAESKDEDPAPADDAEDEVVETGQEALWIKSTAFGDDKDRVLVRGDGRPAYISADVAYLQNKFDRGFESLKLIVGPDHHGYVGRLYAASRALGHSTGRDGEFEMIIYQAVRFVKDGKPAHMRKRDGNIYELRDLISELGQTAAPDQDPDEQSRIGADVGRFFFLMRSFETHMDFDIDLATKQSDENPVFYAQYAHARICSVLDKAQASGFMAGAAFDSTLLVHPRELSLIKKVMELPLETARCAADYGVHRLATYAVELGRAYHHFYDACRVNQPDEPALSAARVALCVATRGALAATFELIGVSAPTRMESGHRS